ncbi:DUF3093 domain-containing protein [Amycolatopsis magusensis]|uniref:DUF3093 domain-containing protein n=1 Tax=Amycolatopsis magusensis TaxID=882444 RepID=A0ABS4PSK7_9PSEU|nr:DUF3093 domain-containing protein [Amycolatopsis magusensis]MBP2182410.1 hypothetical protein [Amycolatopsis magusensis]MDI5977262.1 DUF3093 domain-containing protein [Amycolatopsis magusensis]
MTESANAADKRAGKITVRHSERLYVPWWLWPLPLLGGGLLAAEIHMGYPGVRAWLPYLIVLPLVVALLLGMGRTKVRVTEEDGGTELWAGDAHLPTRFMGAVEVIAKPDKRRVLGRDADPAAFVVHRGWVGPALRVWVEDPDDPTPYWLISTRKPEALAELLTGHRPA